MAIVKVDPKADQSLPEYHVGKASQSCIFPGIAQCFAIAGWTQSGMLCTHVSPGATKDDISQTFAALRDLGGGEVMFWYVVGPFTQHFAVAKAQWRSVKDIKKTFQREFKNTAAAHWALDATDERNTVVHDPRFTIPYTFSGIDVLAEHRGYESMIWFSYKEWMKKVEYRRFQHAKFKRF
jgi:hypothetical protein